MREKTMAGATSTQGMRQAPGHRATTTVFLLAATTAGTRSSCQEGRDRSGRSEPSPEVVATFRMTCASEAPRSQIERDTCTQG